MNEPKTTTAKTKPKDKNAVTEHREDVFNLVIGFEVNDPHAYREALVVPNGRRKVHFVMEDPGHTFMYLTKNRKISFFYSLGPHDGASDQERAYGYGTPEYKIPGATHLFRFNLSEAQHDQMLAKGKEYRADVLAQRRYYNILKNFTCARSARDIIAAGWTGVPKGSSFVGVPGIVLEDVVNPYAFYNDIHTKYPKGEVQLSAKGSKWRQLMLDGNSGKLPADPTLNPSTWPR